MGGGGYSSSSRLLRATTSGFYSQSREETFKQRKVHEKMDPKGLRFRESCDSEEHPESLAIIIALDMTGSMQDIPHEFIKDGLPSIIERLQKVGIEHPQVMFMGIGDHVCDRGPLQIGQFESSDELMDFWLQHVWIEGGGGGNGGESYGLAHYIAAYHTKIDCFDKRGQKGFLFTIGNEPNHTSYTKYYLEEILGKGEYKKEYSAKELIEAAEKMYNVVHFNITDYYPLFIVNSTFSGKAIQAKSIQGIINSIPEIIISNSKKTAFDVSTSLISEDKDKDSTNIPLSIL